MVERVAFAGLLVLPGLALWTGKKKQLRNASSLITLHFPTPTTSILKLGKGQVKHECEQRRSLRAARKHTVRLWYCTFLDPVVSHPPVVLSASPAPQQEHRHQI